VNAPLQQDERSVYGPAAAAAANASDSESPLPRQDAIICIYASPEFIHLFGNNVNQTQKDFKIKPQA
jgi:hypothetical protein